MMRDDSLGVSAAGAVRVGQAIGRRDPRGATNAGWMALAIGVMFMTCAALTFIGVPARLVRLFFQPVLIAWALWSTGAWRLIRRRT